jgi:hypothetical protein
MFKAYGAFQSIGFSPIASTLISSSLPILMAGVA